MRIFRGKKFFIILQGKAVAIFRETEIGELNDTKKMTKNINLALARL